MTHISSIKHLAFILKCKSSEKEILKMCGELSDTQFKYDKNFYSEIIKTSEKNGKIKTRSINPSHGRLKLLQSRIKKNVLDKIEFPAYVQGANRGYSNITNAKLHQGKKFKFTTDIKKFFPSITPSQVYNSFCNHGFKPEVSRALTILCTYKGKIPQGASTSAHIANMAFKEIDSWIDEYCKCKNITYSRYIDDISLSSPIDFKDSLQTIIDRISASGYSISSPKTSYKHVINVTGIRVGNNNLRPDKKFYEKLDLPQSDSAKKGRIEYLKRVTNS